MSQPWTPKRSLPEVEALILAKGGMHETHECLVDGVIQRVYKNMMWPTLRVFWLWAAQQHKDLVYTVFEGRRFTFGQTLERSLKAAAILKDTYGVRKGDRVSICAKNIPEYLEAFWACHLIGAVSTLPNAWSPLDTLRHCLVNTDSKVIIVDSERANVLEPISEQLAKEAGCVAIFVMGSQEKRVWNGMKSWEDEIHDFQGDYLSIMKTDPGIHPDDNATILFTSGTTGMPKGVLGTHRQFLTNSLNVLVAIRRAAWRRGEEPPTPVPTNPQKALLLSVPLFHVTGLTSMLMFASMVGIKVVMMSKWKPEKAIRLIKEENVVIAGGVPSMITDIIDSDRDGIALESLMFGGAPPPETLTARTRQALPSAALSQGYGLTETNGVAVSFGAEDYLARPTSCGLPTPINNVLIVDSDNVAVPAGTVGEVWLKGPNIMKGYWKDQAATDKALTRDGWFKTGDLGLIDKEGFLYIRDRIKDIIIRGGENVDSVTVENALYGDERILEAAAVGVPDRRLGELVAAVVSVKKPFHGKVSEKDIIKFVQKRLPKFAVPVMVLVQDEQFERTPSGKILKGALRKLAGVEWAKRSTNASGGKVMGRL